MSDHISLIKNLLITTTEDMRRQSDLISTFKESVNENVNGIKNLQTLQTDEDVLMHKTNIEFNTQQSDDKSYSSSNHNHRHNND